MLDDDSPAAGVPPRHFHLAALTTALGTARGVIRLLADATRDTAPELAAKADAASIEIDGALRGGAVMSAPVPHDVVDAHAVVDVLQDAVHDAAEAAVRAGLPVDFVATTIAALAVRQFVLRHGAGKLDTVLQFIRESVEDESLWGDDKGAARRPPKGVWQ